MIEMLDRDAPARDIRSASVQRLQRQFAVRRRAGAARRRTWRCGCLPRCIRRPTHACSAPPRCCAVQPPCMKWAWRCRTRAITVTAKYIVRARRRGRFRRSPARAPGHAGAGAARRPAQSRELRWPPTRCCAIRRSCCASPSCCAMRGATRPRASCGWRSIGGRLVAGRSTRRGPDAHPQSIHSVA